LQERANDSPKRQVAPKTQESTQRSQLIKNILALQHVKRAFCRAGFARRIELSGIARPTRYFPYEGEMELRVSVIRLATMPRSVSLPIGYSPDV
jgi:hypothetical protein